MAGGEDKKKPPVVTPEGAAVPPPRALTDAEFLELGRQGLRELEAKEADRYRQGPPPPPVGPPAPPPDAGVPPPDAGTVPPYPSPSGWVDPPTEPPPGQTLPEFKADPGTLGATKDKGWQAPPIPIEPPPQPVARAPFELPELAPDVPAEPAAQPTVAPTAPDPAIAAAGAYAAAEQNRQLVEEVAKLRAQVESLTGTKPKEPSAPGSPGSPGSPLDSPLAETMGGGPHTPGTGIDWSMAGRQGLPAPQLPQAVGPGPREPGPGIDIVGLSREADRVRQQQALEAEAARQAALQKEYGGALGMTGAGIYGAARGLTLSLSDPVIALGAAGVVAVLSSKPFGEAYDDARKDIEGMRQANPGISLGAELTTAIVPTLLTGGAGAAGQAARMTPVGAVAALAERKGADIAAKALTKGAGPVGAAVRGFGAAGALEGAIGGAGAGLAEATYPGNYDSPARFVEELGKGTLLGSGLGAGFGAAVGGTLAKVRGKPEAVDEILGEFKKQPLPDISREDLTGIPIDEGGVSHAELRKTAEAMGEDRDAVITFEDIAARDTRGKHERRISQVRMATGGQKELKQKLVPAQLEDAKKLAELTYKHDQETSIAGKRKKVEEFDEKDGAKPLYEKQDKQQTLDFDPPPLDLPKSQAAQAEVDQVFSNLNRMIDDFVVPGEGVEPATRPEATLLGRMKAQLFKAQESMRVDLAAGKIGRAYETYLEGVKGLLVKQLDRAVVQDSPRLGSLLADLMDQTGEVPGFATSARNVAFVELPVSFPRANEVQAQIDSQMGRLHSQLEDFVTRNYGSDEVLKHDSATFGMVKRLRDLFNDQHGLINQDLNKGKVGAAYMRFDQKIKAAIGKEAQNAKSTVSRDFLRNLTSEPMNFLEGKNPAGVKVPHLWDRYINAQDAIARVLNKLDEMKKAAKFDGAKNVQSTIDKTAGRVRAVIRRKDMNAWQSKEYLDQLRNRIALSVNNPRVWDLENSGALATRAELAAMLKDEPLWEALSLAESQYIGNKPWSRAIHTSDDSAWNQFYSKGPERIPGEWDNLEQANSQATSSLFERVGDAAVIRDGQSYLLNLRSIASDAAARQRAWGKNAPKMKPEDAAGIERTKEIVDIARRMEARVKLMAWANNEAREGAAYLAGEPGLEAIGGALGGAAAGAALGNAFVGGAAGAFLGSQRLPRSIYRAVAETQAGTDNLVAKSARGLLRTARMVARGTEVTAEALKNARAGSVAAAIARLPSDKKVQEHIEGARALTDPSSPESLSLLKQAAELEEMDPKVADELVTFEQRRATYVAGNAPADDRFDPAKTRQMARIVTAAYYPERTLKNMSEGVASKEEIDALKVVFPEIFRVWEVELEKLFSEKGTPKSRQEELLVYRLAGLTTKGALDAQRIQKAQMWASPDPRTEQPGRGAVGNRAAQTYKSSPERYTTKSDRIMAQ